MAGIICKQCGYENPEGSTICEICAEDLVNSEELNVSSQQQVKEDIQPVTSNTQFKTNTVQQTTNNIHQNNEHTDNNGKEYYVICPESQTKTILASDSVTRFFCEGCKREHEIDGFLWNIESNDVASAFNESQDNVNNQTVMLGNNSCNQNSKPKGDNLYLEEINTHHRIDIDKAGGILGRYGKYGAEYFQSNGLLTVSGEHCMLSYEFGNWVVRHISRTNETKYNNMILGANEPNLLENGKVLTLANSVSFIVRIG